MGLSSIVIRWQILELAEEEDRRQALRQRRRKPCLLQQHNAFKNASEVEFVKKFRLGQTAVRQLAEDVLPLLQKQLRRDGITGMTKLLIALAFYATGSYQSLIGQSVFHNVSQATVSRSVRQVTEALNDPRILQKYIHWPFEKEERKQIKEKFARQIPGVIGCIDGTHVAIIKPNNNINDERFYNSKGYHSLNVMIICDAEEMITCVDASSPGAVTDSSVFQSHPLSQMMSDLVDSGEEVFLLGDSGYALQKTLITPILNTVEGTPERNFYNLHVSAHNSVKRCIAMLKARFRCLLAARALHYDCIRAGKIVNACCILHNIAQKSGAAFTPLSSEELEEENRRQCQVDYQLSCEVERKTEEVDGGNYYVKKPDLQGGLALQQLLIDKLWQERI